MRKIKHQHNRDELEFYIKSLIQKKYTLKEVSKSTGYSVSHLYILKKKYLKRGRDAFINGHRGKPVKRAVAKEIKDKIVNLYAEKYLGKTFNAFHKILELEYSLKLSYSTVYGILKNAGFTSPISHPDRKTQEQKEESIFQRRFKTMLKKQNFTRIEIASKTNLSISAISYYLSGRREPRGGYSSHNCKYT